MMIGKNSRYRSITCLVAAIVSFLSAYVYANQIRSAKELENLRGKIQKLQSDLDSAKSEEYRLITGLNDIEKQRVMLQVELHNQTKSLKKLYREQKRTKSRVEKLQAASELADEDLKSLVQASYLLSKKDGMQLLLGNKNPSEIATALSMYKYIVESKQEQIEKFREQQLKLMEETERLAKQQTKVQEAVTQLEQTELAIEESSKKKSGQLELIQKQLSDQETKISYFRRRESELLLLLKNLARKESEIIPEEENRSGVGESVTKTLVEHALRPGGFVKNKGRLPMPTDAKIKNRFGEKRPESGLAWDGLMFAVKQGQKVSAVYPGQVIFSDWFRGYGQLLVLDHGDGYMSLYGHNQSLRVDQGQLVEAGDVIARAGDTGGLKTPSLYFEIRANGNPENPLNWFRL